MANEHHLDTDEFEVPKGWSVEMCLHWGQTYLRIVIVKKGPKQSRGYPSGIMLNEKTSCHLRDRGSRVHIGKNDLRGWR